MKALQVRLKKPCSPEEVARGTLLLAEKWTRENGHLSYIPAYAEDDEWFTLTLNLWPSVSPEVAAEMATVGIIVPVEGV
jgi:hypothetical protein